MSQPELDQGYIYVEYTGSFLSAFTHSTLSFIIGSVDWDKLLNELPIYSFYIDVSKKLNIGQSREGRISMYFS